MKRRTIIGKSIKSLKWFVIASRTSIILSGQKLCMRNLVLPNPAINYRFPMWVDFEDYDKKELFEMAFNILSEKGYLLNQEAEKELRKAIAEIDNTEAFKLRNGFMVQQYLKKKSIG